MPTQLHLKCDGCDAEAHSEAFRKRFESVSGRAWGFGAWKTPELDTIVPPGWVWCDPHTACTYCPECWKQIESDKATAMGEDDGSCPECGTHQCKHASGIV
jgi:hypothetical protein